MNLKRLLSVVVILTFVLISVYHQWSTTYPSLIRNSYSKHIRDSSLHEKELHNTVTKTTITTATTDLPNHPTMKIVMAPQTLKLEKVIKNLDLDNEPLFINGPSSTYLQLTPQGMYKLANRPTQIVTNKKFYQRNDQIRENCKRSRINNSLNLGRMIYDDKHKLIMCVVPKNACTSWKRMFWYLLGHLPNRERINFLPGGRLALDTGHLPLLSKLSKAKAIEKLLTYTSFVVMRDPYARLVSAHSNKFSKTSSKDAYKSTRGRRIAQRLASSVLKNSFSNISLENYSNLRELAPDLPEKEAKQFLKHLQAIKNGEISFDQFTRYITTEPDSQNFDVHWRPQTDLCNPCVANYNIVIKFEELGAESNHLLNYIQRNEGSEKQIRFNTSVKSTSSREKILNYYKPLDSERIKKVKAVYQNDFNTFGYNDVLEL